MWAQKICLNILLPFCGVCFWLTFEFENFYMENNQNTVYHRNHVHYTTFSLLSNNLKYEM